MVVVVCMFCLVKQCLHLFFLGSLLESTESSLSVGTLLFRRAVLEIYLVKRLVCVSFQSLNYLVLMHWRIFHNCNSVGFPWTPRKGFTREGFLNLKSAATIYGNQVHFLLLCKFHSQIFILPVRLGLLYLNRLFE